jgi:hypothetical protein
MKRRIALCLALMLLAGCTNLAPTVPTSAPADPASGYVAGLFNRDGASFALVLRALDGAAVHTLPMGEDTRWPSNLSKSSVAIRVPPGTYVIADWFSYSTVDKGLISRAPNTEPSLATPFTVSAGEVVHLGEFTVESRRFRNPARNAILFRMRVHPHWRPAPTVISAFRSAYPGFASQPIRCVFCQATTAP